MKCAWLHSLAFVPAWHPKQRNERVTCVSQSRVAFGHLLHHQFIAVVFAAWSAGTTRSWHVGWLGLAIGKGWHRQPEVLVETLRCPSTG